MLVDYLKIIRSAQTATNNFLRLILPRYCALKNSVYDVINRSSDTLGLFHLAFIQVPLWVTNSNVGLSDWSNKIGWKKPIVSLSRWIRHILNSSKRDSSVNMERGKLMFGQIIWITFCNKEPLFLAHFRNNIHSIGLPMQVCAFMGEPDDSGSLLQK